MAAADNDEQTHLRPGPGTAVTSDSGWLTSSGSVDHGRFAPGTILDNRYRILGLLGRGGMGEVYRADDLRLAQQVALKFLPTDLSGDPVRLAQFHNEVRTARQVSHPNVCRVYDIGEIDGQLFITMEYVDGEDLSILLRRIGRLPEDKALDIARQICAGLAAAHERGILHRDLKPANVMLDGAGKVRIMDFSLAAAGEVKDVRAGTPAYMAPEQLGGQEVTVRSDIYALGLVLYEIFTGRRAFTARSLTELIEQHQTGAITAPTTLVKTLDSTIEQAILRCLEPEPARRPPSALAVSAALPGGDPLAAALAAGETPSPEMVAAAGGDTATMTTTSAVAWMIATAALVFAFVALAQRYELFSRVPLGKPSAVLVDRAEELRQSFGYTEKLVDRASGFAYDDQYLSWAARGGSGSTRWAELPVGRPAALRYWYRTSPIPLIPFNPGSSVGQTDPPVAVSGMTRMLVDTKGRLLRFEAAPPQVERSEPASNGQVNWQQLFAAAGIDPAAFKEAAPQRTPATYADERKAWEGVLPETNLRVRIEAAGYRGRPVSFDIVGPWSVPTRDQAYQPPSNFNAIFIYTLLAAAAFIAYTNVRRGRADRHGALMLAVFVTLLLVTIWAISPHVSDANQEQGRFFNRTGLGMFIGGALYLIYLGLEPFVRRAWPSMLVGWSRVMSGRVKDPIVGRDIAIGVACGAALTLFACLQTWTQLAAHLPEPRPPQPDLSVLMGTRGLALTLLGAANVGLQNALITVFEFSVLRGFFEWAAARARLRLNPRTSERVFIALAIAVATVLTLSNNGGASQRLIDIAFQAISSTVVLLVLIRIGLLASTVMFFANLSLLRVPVTFNSDAIYATESWTVVIALLALAALGVWWARFAGISFAGTSRTVPART